MSEFREKVLEHFDKTKYAELGSPRASLAAEMQLASEGNGLYWLTLYKRISSGFVGSKNHINSILAYCCGVTTAKPNVEAGFSPKQDWVPVRFSNPDIDCDFENNTRIFAYLRERFGHERVGNIGTYAGMQVKSAFQNSVKFESKDGSPLNIIQNFFLPNYDRFEKKPKSWKKLYAEYQALDSAGKKKFEVNIADSARHITKILDLESPDGSSDISKLSWDELVEDKEINQALKQLYPKVFERAYRAHGSLIHAGSHAAGIVMVPGLIDDELPMHWVGKGADRKWCTQWDMEDLDAAGYLKFDVLGVKSLEILHKAVRYAEDRVRRSGINSDFKIDVYKLKKNEESCDKIMQLFADGNTCGVFQFEGGAMTKYMQKMQPSRFEELVAGTALFRPGPIKNQFHEDFIENKNGRDGWKNSVVNQEMFNLLEPTHGLFVYQEQIMTATKILAGFSATEADELRKIIGKKALDKMGPMREKFVARASSHGVIDSKLAEYYWEQFEKFGAYCFNQCLDGSMTILDKKSGKLITIEELVSSGNYGNGIVVDSCTDGRIVEDAIVEAYYTGDNEIYEVELSNGMVVKCTMRHKFLCQDGQMRELQDIIKGDHSIICG